MSDNAKVTYALQDKSSYLTSLAGISIGTVINAAWGPVVPTLNTDPNLQNLYSTPDPAKGSSWLGAQLLCSSSNSVYINRAIHSDASYAASLTRFKITQPDFNDFQNPSVTPDPIILPLDGGISLEGLASYEFPLYASDRVYVNTGLTVLNTYNTSETLVVSGLNFVGGDLEVGEVISFGNSPSDSSNIYTIQDATTTTVVEHLVVVSASVTAVEGTELKVYKSSAWHSYTVPVHLISDSGGTTSVIVDSSQYIEEGDIVSIDGGTTQVTVVSKSLISVPQSTIVLNQPVSVSAGTVIQYMSVGNVSYHDAFLVTAIYPGALGNQIRHAIRASINYSYAFNLDVYFKDVLVETYEVSRNKVLDGFGNQLYLEDKINGVSKYIVVKDNTSDTTAAMPLNTTYGIWQQDPKPVYQQSGISLAATSLKGDTVIIVTSASGFTVGERFVFGSTGTNEYKILSISGNNITLDRAVIESSVAIGTILYNFDATVNDHPNGIYAGVQYYKWQMTPPFTANNIGDTYTLSSIVGTILDAGDNSMVGGSDGSNITVSDIITAFNAMSNDEEFDIACFCDNGFAYPEVAIALDVLATERKSSHSYLSTSYSSEIQSDYNSGMTTYRHSTNLNTSHSSMFGGWIKVTDTYNQTKVWVSPAVFGLISQSFVTRTSYIFTPAAGWVNGIVSGLDITNKFTDGDRQNLLQSGINPIRYRKGYGLSIWGNTTLYSSPSYLQLRSVAMLIVGLIHGLDSYLEYQLFDFNNASEWKSVTDQISTYIRDTFLIPGGVIGFQVKIAQIITSTDIDNKRMPIFIGLQPTSDIELIPVTIGLFNSSVQLT